MSEINLKTWEEFESRLKELESDRKQQNAPFPYECQFLYRGQRNSKLSLSTTLERSGREKVSLKDYHKLISKVKPQIESFTGKNWNILSYSKGIDAWLAEWGSQIPQAFGWSEEFTPTLSYMTYLRHYGFPSPLLDWSRSPYVAAYFAFRDIQKVNDGVQYVSIYVYLESNSGITIHGSNEPWIYTIGPYISTDRRHFIQQCQYTIYVFNENGTWQYKPYERAFNCSDPPQNFLWKFNIPASERIKVLKILDSYNINDLSLFGNEESLMKTMAMREIHLTTQ